VPQSLLISVERMVKLRTEDYGLSSSSFSVFLEPGVHKAKRGVSVHL